MVSYHIFSSAKIKYFGPNYVISKFRGRVILVCSMFVGVLSVRFLGAVSGFWP